MRVEIRPPKTLMIMQSAKDSRIRTITFVHGRRRNTAQEKQVRYKIAEPNRLANDRGERPAKRPPKHPANEGDSHRKDGIHKQGQSQIVDEESVDGDIQNNPGKA